MIDPQLKDRVAIITGANHGIGAAAARLLAAQRARVFVTFYRPPSPYSDRELAAAREAGTTGDRLYAAMQQQSGAHIAHQIRAGGGMATAEELDLGEVASIKRLFDLCEERLGPADILVLNHAHCVPETFDPAAVRNERPPIILPDAESIDRHFTVNARASALLMREFLRRHLARGANWGRIITLTTTLRHARNVSYAASKRALVSYSLSAAAEMGRYGITVNVVCPGVTQTGYVPPAAEAALVARTPLGRLGHPEDIANTILFLASEQGGWLTGQLIYASGGFTMYMNE